MINDDGSNVGHQVNGSHITIHNSSFEEFAKVLTKPYKQQLAEKDREMSKKDRQLAEKEKRIHDLEAQLRHQG